MLFFPPGLFCLIVFLCNLLGDNWELDAQWFDEHDSYHACYLIWVHIHISVNGCHTHEEYFCAKDVIVLIHGKWPNKSVYWIYVLCFHHITPVQDGFRDDRLRKSRVIYISASIFGCWGPTSDGLSLGGRLCLALRNCYCCISAFHALIFLFWFRVS